MRAERGSLPLTWLVNGSPVRTGRFSRDATWTADGAGYAEIVVIDAEGRSSSATVFVE